ncbi:MAG: hypothetical protein U5P41_07275 [Gammaproteobacteria bacterium]|nr:hypothetical protein [Gammaproteobacteria bacterium]
MTKKPNMTRNGWALMALERNGNACRQGLRLAVQESRSATRTCYA